MTHKGRDLFDLWVALTQLGLTPDDILSAFEPYRPEGLTSALSIANLETKLAKPDFRNDLTPLIATTLDDYDPDVAGRLVIDRLLARIGQTSSADGPIEI